MQESIADADLSMTSQGYRCVEEKTELTQPNLHESETQTMSKDTSGVVGEEDDIWSSIAEEDDFMSDLQQIALREYDYHHTEPLETLAVRSTFFQDLHNPEQTMTIPSMPSSFRLLSDVAHDTRLSAKTLQKLIPCDQLLRVAQKLQLASAFFASRHGNA